MSTVDFMGRTSFVVGGDRNEMRHGIYGFSKCINRYEIYILYISEMTVERASERNTGFEDGTGDVDRNGNEDEEEDHCLRRRSPG